MDHIRNAINNVYKEAEFSNEKKAETFQKLQPKRKQFITPLIVTIFVTGCLLLGLNMLLFQDSIESVFHQTSAISPEIYPEFSGKLKDFTVLKQPWMIVGIVVIAISFCYAAFALVKKWLWQLLLSVIIMIAVLGNISEHIGYRYYAKDEADILNILQAGVLAVGNREDLHLNDTLTINQYRFGYFTGDYFHLIVIFKHDGKGYALDQTIQSDLSITSAIHLRNDRYIIIPLLEGHAIKKVIVKGNSENIEVVLDSSTAQFMAIPYEKKMDSSEISVQAVDDKGNMFELYGPSDFFTYPVNLK